MNPKFQIGEPAYLVCEHYPEHMWLKVEIVNREYRDFWVSISTGKCCDSGYGYYISPNPGHPGLPWSESFLRKVNPDTFEKCEEGWSVEKLKEGEMV